MHLYLNGELTRRVKAIEAEGRVSITPGVASCDWYVCQACGWVTYTATSGQPARCPRPPDDTTAIMTAMFQTKRNGMSCTSTPVVRIKDIAPRVADALDAAYRVGGTNACIEILSNLTGIDIGLDDPGGIVSASAVARLEELRPNSVAPPRKRRG